MIDAVGTFSLIIVFTSVGGIISYILNGLYVSSLPPYSVGYINLPQFAIHAVASIPMAQVGVLAAHKMPEKHVHICSPVTLYGFKKPQRFFIPRMLRIRGV